MRKNGSRLISLTQYRITDLLVFTAIVIVFDLLAHYAPMALPVGAMFNFTITVPIVLMVMFRWGWMCVFPAVADAILMCVLNNPEVWQSYVCYIIGNACILLLLTVLKFWKKNKIAGKWYFSALFVILGWLLQNFALTLAMTACGQNFVECLSLNFGFGWTGILSLAMGIVIILVMRRLDGMFEDQKSYLLRLDKERKERALRDEFGDEAIEVDEETVSILRKHDDDLY